MQHRQESEGWNRHFGDMIIFLCLITFGQLLPYPVIVLAMLGGLMWFFTENDVMKKVIVIGLIVLLAQAVMLEAMIQIAYLISK